ncbi:MAG: MlaD family protein [Thermodesulfovibrionales bacterium]|nr:MlaD family protein [Thermodesulfovibrionales bacterium]
MFDMKKQIKLAKLKVGIVITIALLILFFTVFFAGGIEELFSPKVEIKANIRDVKGLRNGSPVWFSGIEVGSVKNMKLHEEYGTLVTLSIREDLLGFIKKDSKVVVQTMGLLGDKYVEITTGSPKAEPIKKGDILEGRPQLEIKDIVDASANSISKLTDFIEKLDRFIIKVETGEGTIGKLISDPSLYRNLNDATKHLSRILTKINDSDGTLTKLLKDPSLYDNIVSVSEKLDSFASNLEEGKGTIGKLVNDSSLYDNLNDLTLKISKISDEIYEGKGTTAVLLKDKELAEELKKSISNLKAVLDELKQLTADIKEQPKKYFKFSLF